MQSTSSITEEQQLVEKLISGDRSSGRIFLEQYGDLIWSIIHAIDNRSNTMESEDLFMETLKHLFDNDYKVLKQFKWQCKLSTYIYMVTRRYILDIIQRENRIKRRICHEVTPDAIMIECDEENDKYSEIQINAYKDAMNKLDPKDAIFIRMLVIENKSTSEVMAFFGWNSENSVYSRKNKVIAKLRSLSKKAIQKKGLV